MVNNRLIDSFGYLTLSIMIKSAMFRLCNLLVIINILFTNKGANRDPFIRSGNSQFKDGCKRRIFPDRTRQYTDRI